MELASDRFVSETRRALEAPVPVLAAIKHGSREEFLGEVKGRDDLAVFEVTAETREELPEELPEWVQSR